MRTGSVVAMGTLEELRRQIKPHIRVCFRLEQVISQADASKIRELPGVMDVALSKETGFDATIKDESTIPSMVDVVVQAGARIRAVEPKHASLEEIYLTLQENDKEHTA